MLVEYIAHDGIMSSVTFKWKVSMLSFYVKYIRNHLGQRGLVMCCTFLAISCLVLISPPVLAQQNIPGNLDTSFNSTDVGFGSGDGFNGPVFAMAVQSDGKIVVGGSFSSYNSTPRNNIVRINTDGSIDNSFNAGFSGIVYTVAIQSDGKIIVGGNFTNPNYGVARLNTNGSVDLSFSPGIGTFNTQNGTIGVVYSIVIQSNGSIYIGGSFSFFSGIARHGVARLNSSGALDQTYNNGGVNGIVYTMAIRSGLLLIGGSFSIVSGDVRSGIARLTTSGGNDNSFNPGGFGGLVKTLVVQSDNLILVGGYFISYNGSAVGRLVRLNGDGSVDSTFDIGSGSNNDIESISIQSDGHILVAGKFTSFNGQPRTGVARLSSNGSLDAYFANNINLNGNSNIIKIKNDDNFIIGGSFTLSSGIMYNRILGLTNVGSIDFLFNPKTGVNGSVTHINILSTSELIIGGNFRSFNDQPSYFITKTNSEGSHNIQYLLGGGTSGVVFSSAEQSDGKLIIGGNFSSVDGTLRYGLARISTNGELDIEFDAKLNTNSVVYSIFLKSDGKIIIGGFFSTVDGLSRNNIAQLNSDGSLDTTFDIGTGTNGLVTSIAVQQNGKIIIVGQFTSVNNVTVNRIAQLRANGTLEESFIHGQGANSTVSVVLAQPDDKFIIGGIFIDINGVEQNRITRLNADGSLDITFNPGMGANSGVSAIAIQLDGKILIGGNFTSYDGIPRNRIARLNADGSLDTSFDPGTGASNGINAIAIQPDGNILIGGGFTSYNGIGRNRIARIFGGDIVGPVNLLLNAGDGQSAPKGSPVAIQPSVLVTDYYDNPVAGVEVAFAVTSGGGSISPLSTVFTDVDGVAALTSWTLGNTLGTNSLTATVDGLTGSPVTFTATAIAIRQAPQVLSAPITNINIDQATNIDVSLTTAGYWAVFAFSDGGAPQLIASISDGGPSDLSSSSGQVRYSLAASGLPALGQYDIIVYEASDPPTDQSELDTWDTNLTQSVTIHVVNPPPGGVWGNVDGDEDGLLSSVDVAYLLQFVVGSREFTPEQQNWLDVSVDGAVNSLDGSYLLQKLLTPNFCLPAENCVPKELATNIELAWRYTSNGTHPLLELHVLGEDIYAIDIKVKPSQSMSMDWFQLPDNWMWARNNDSTDTFILAMAGADPVASWPILKIPAASGSSIGTAFDHVMVNGKRLQIPALPSLSTSLDDTSTLPTEFSIEPNYPNPFNPSTNLRVNLPESGNVTITIFDLVGRVVAQLPVQALQAGRHTILFDASHLGSGVYLYRIQAGNWSAISKMTLVK